MKKVKVIVEALVEVPDDQIDAELLDGIYHSGLGPEDKVKVTKVSLPGVVQREDE